MMRIMLRWLIRISLAMFCLASIAAWIGSYVQRIDITWSRGMSCVSATVQCGDASASFYSTTIPPARRVYIKKSVASSEVAGKVYRLTAYHLLGVAYHPRTAEWTDRVLIIPFWLPTIGSAIILWLAWRKRGRKAAIEAMQPTPPP